MYKLTLLVRTPSYALVLSLVLPGAIPVSAGERGPGPLGGPSLASVGYPRLSSNAVPGCHLAIQTFRGRPPFWGQPSPSVHRLLPLPPQLALRARAAPPPPPVPLDLADVTTVAAKDAPVDLGSIVDAAAYACALYPLGLLATIGSECGLSGVCARNFQYFLQWWGWTLSLIPHFHASIWNHWSVAHHEPPIAPYSGKQLSLAASLWLYHQGLGGVMERGRWFPGRPGYSKTQFEHGTLYCWPATRRCKVAG